MMNSKSDRQTTVYVVQYIVLWTAVFVLNIVLSLMGIQTPIFLCMCHWVVFEASYSHESEVDKRARFD